MKCEANRCPGCSRHCCLDAPKCKYGCKYAMKMQAQPEPKKKYKWEKFADREGVLGQLILSGRRAKKALLGRKSTEEQLLKNLSAQEREQLACLLAKLASPAKCV